jgi:hypothetical protein
MTRKTIFQLMLALLLLKGGNATAYWHVLPKGMKGYRLWSARFSVREAARKESERVFRWISKHNRKCREFAVMISNPGAVEPIAERAFRLPFRVVA